MLFSHELFLWQIFFKMDKYGQGVGFQFSDIMANKDLDFNNFSKRMVLEMCIMSGCDYLPSLPGMGVKKAHGLIKRFKTYQMVAILDLHTFD
jgi:exonuclease-1